MLVCWSNPLCVFMSPAQRGAGAEPPGGVGLRPAVRLVGRSGSAAGE